MFYIVRQLISSMQFFKSVINLMLQFDSQIVFYQIIH